MKKAQFGDAGPLLEIARQMQSCDDLEKLEWIKAMLQGVIEGNRRGDAVLFCPTFLTLHRPTHRELADLLDVEPTSFERPWGRGGKDAIEAIDLSWGPDTVEVVKVTDKNMFGMPHRSMANEVIAEANKRHGFVTCPPWVAAALCIKSYTENEVQYPANKRVDFFPSYLLARPW